MRFAVWLAENSLSAQLRVPQNPHHHPEGNVKRHTFMVRASMDSAVQLLQQKQQQDPEGPLANLDLSFGPQDRNVLRLAAWLHDIGKSVTTDPEKLTAYGHEDPENFEKAMKNLGPWWHDLYNRSPEEDRQDLWFAIKHHMSLDGSKGFENRALKIELMDSDGRYRNERRVKVLLALLLMDRMGRGGRADFKRGEAKQFAQQNTDLGQQRIQGLYASADWRKKRDAYIAAHAAKPMPDDPAEFVRAMREKGKPDPIIRQALRGKFPNLSDEEIGGTW